MSWKTFEENCPELATLGFDRLHKKIGYLALLNKDGSPRLHPITPFIGNGMLFMFTEPTSPKIRDLRRDGRYALHCSVSREGVLIEYMVYGNAEVVSDPSVRANAEKVAASPVITDSYVLFDFQVERVLVVEYDEERKKLVRRWQRVQGGIDG
jgi:hypothetical protein